MSTNLYENGFQGRFVNGFDIKDGFQKLTQSVVHITRLTFATKSRKKRNVRFDSGGPFEEPGYATPGLERRKYEDAGRMNSSLIKKTPKPSLSAIWRKVMTIIGPWHLSPGRLSS
jgi:hypothetical protein